ncbi:MAG: glycerate kinase [Acetobacteraceae bacterium]|nr:glycerate kinase [Acetobacteraceae bacterium]
MSWTDHNARAALRAMFSSGIASADPLQVLARHLPSPPPGRVVVVGAGKSAALMAAAVEAAWADVPLSGVVVTRYDHAIATQRIEVIEASHPVPDDNSERGARRVMEAVQGLGADDLVLVLMSGGASALIELPADGLTLADIKQVNRSLLACGAPIEEMNAVRKHLSAIKGGRLAAAAAPARVVTLAISDVPGDDPATIGSGPTLPDASTWHDVRAIASRYGLSLPRQDGPETPKPGELAPEVHLIATPSIALEAAAATARAHGLAPLILGDALEGESREMGVVMAGIARSVRHGHPLPAPCVLLSGGEGTVSIGTGAYGRGGRNTEFLLSLAVALRGAPGIWALAGDTDGIDGTEDAAGAVIAPDTLARARAAGLDPLATLLGHDSYTLFDAIGDLVKTGPTLTNVNDFRAILVA